MKIALRMMSLATSILWGVLVIFLVTAAYSATLIEIQFEEPKVYVSEVNTPTVTLLIVVNNKGYYTIEEFTLQTEILDENETKITSHKTYVAEIPAGKKTLVMHNMTFPIDELTMEVINLLFNDVNLTLTSEVELKFTELLPIKIQTNTSFLWGAPFYNFTIGEPAFQQYNLTHYRLAMPISFENHALFDINGTLSLNILNQQNTIIAAAKLPIYVPSTIPYFNILEVYIKNTEPMFEGRVEVLFESENFSFGPWVMPFG